MPGNYAHYRFGAAIFRQLPPEVRPTVQRFRQMYDVGLHGPDLFLYHNIFFRDSVVSLGKAIHAQTGQEVFPRICKRLRLEPNDAARAYLYGLLAHYCLDSVCHPFIREKSADGTISHVELETEFDRYLLQLDGNHQPNCVDCSHHMKLTPGECATVAELYPPATAATVNICIRSMAFFTKVLATPNGRRRKFLESAAGAGNKKLTAFFMDRIPNKNCAHLDGELLALYEQAVEKYPVLLAQLQAHLSHNAPLGEDFGVPFG